MGKVTFCTSELKRPAKVWKILKKAFIGRSCLECGICCSDADSEFMTPVIGNEPHRDSLLHAARTAHHTRVEPAMNGGFNIVGGECCALLEDKSGRKGCKVYSIRPLICAMFPFILTRAFVPGSEEEDSEISRFIAVTTKCPPVKELAERGVTYLVTTDVLGNNLPILTESFKSIVAYMNMRLPLLLGSILTKDGKPVFPVL